MFEEKYIELLLERCLRLEKGTPLFINYNKVIKAFVSKIVKHAKKLGITDIYLDERDLNAEHELLLNLNVNDIPNENIFNCKVWDEYAKKDAAFLLLDSDIPNLMDDVDSEKIAKASFSRQTTKPLYKEKQLKSLIPWCIAAVPNEFWAKDIFPKSKNPVETFWEVLGDICMLNSDNPISSWNKQLKEQARNIEKLNNLNIKKLHLKNSLGTDLEIELLKDSLWQSASTGEWIVNIPSYEIFTSPNYKKTNGIVYSSKPLVYSGKIIDKFYLKFKNGKVEEFGAKEGQEILKEIINTDELSSYLGEVAIVNYDSPISNTKMIFKSTLFDENASCHLALGSGFLECLKDVDKYDEEELETIGMNSSKNHVDFMIGTKDLIIEADTKEGTIVIMKDGNLVI
ncbi:MAG: aminopeptidase [Firmicutes bacterium]|nr:aminopeptidase [Bacillota bacterium]